jgi:Protein of unknown function (DUF1579)
LSDLLWTLDATMLLQTIAALVIAVVLGTPGARSAYGATLPPACAAARPRRRSASSVSTTSTSGRPAAGRDQQEATTRCEDPRHVDEDRATSEGGTAMSTTPDPPQPDPALRRLDRLVGRWSMEGNLVGSDEKNIRGETTFRWLPGGFFLEQRAHIDFAGQQIDALELIAYDHVSLDRLLKSLARPAAVPVGRPRGQRDPSRLRTGRSTPPSPARGVRTAPSRAAGARTPAPTRP